MLKPLEIEYRGRLVVLECTHKRDFPPPVMYGHTVEDIDVMWRSGNITHTTHQFLQTWNKECGLMVMGPKCLDCHLAKKQNPRPGRPSVIETESWLERKERMYWDDMAAAGDRSLANAAHQPQHQEDIPPEFPIQSELFPVVTENLPPQEEPTGLMPEAQEVERTEKTVVEKDSSDLFGFNLDDEDIVDRLVDD